MGFQFIIPKEVVGHSAKVYKGEVKDDHTVRVCFELNEQPTFTDYEKIVAEEKLEKGEWLRI